MRVKDIMTSNPACAVGEESLTKVAQLMVEYDCGEIPIVEDKESKKPIGVITDRDIVCRTIGRGINPMDLTARDVMSEPIVTVMPETSFEECCQLMEDKQIRRIPVVDANGACCGIVSVADVARYSSKEAAGEVVQEVSVEIGSPSNVN